METLNNNLSLILQDAFNECGYADITVSVSVSDRPDLCQFQCNSCFICAKKYRKAPIAIANEICNFMVSNKVFKKIEPNDSFE